MTGAFVYIIACSWKNRIVRRLRRLREPRYFLGAAVGAAYIYVTLFMRGRAYRTGDGRRAPVTPWSLFPAFGTAGPVVGAVLLALAAAASWAMPFSSGLLDLSQAETAILVPSPVTRRQLVVYRIMRSQLAVLTGALIMALAYPMGSLFARVRGLLGLWLLLMTSHVFFTGVTLARTKVLARDRTAWFVRPAALVSFGPLVVVTMALIRAARAGALSSAGEVIRIVTDTTTHGLGRLLLLPFTLVIGPLFAGTPQAFAVAVAGSAAMYLVAVAWLLWADASSPEAADAGAQRVVTAPTAKRQVYVARPLAWRLRPLGSPEGAFLWKGALQTFRLVDRRVLVRLGLIITWMVLASVFATRARGVVQLLAIFCAWGTAFAALMAPQVIRTDMRQDLARLELLKTWPVRGASVLRGEILWPAILVVTIAGTFGVVGLVLGAVSFTSWWTPTRLAMALTGLIVMPGVVVTQYVIHNAVAVLLPGWVPLGATRPRGVDAMGQRLILLGATWLALMIALVPGGGITAVLWMALRRTAGPWILVVGGLITLALIAVEVLVATEALGPAYERLDITSVERAE
jgi:hypothetical protein